MVLKLKIGEGVIEFEKWFWCFGGDEEFDYLLNCNILFGDFEILLKCDWNWWENKVVKRILYTSVYIIMVIFWWWWSGCGKGLIGIYRSGYFVYLIINMFLRWG